MNFNNSNQTASDQIEIESWVGSVKDWIWQDRDRDEPSSIESCNLRTPDENYWAYFLFETAIEAINECPVEEGKKEQSEEEPTLATSSLGKDKELQSLRQRVLFLTQHWTGWLLRSLHDAAADGNQEIEIAIYQQIPRLYGSLHAKRMPTAEGLVLQLLSWNRHSAGLRMLADILVAYPPHDWSATAIAISPLMRTNQWSVSDVFPKLIEATQHPTTIAPVIDLANYVTRQAMVTAHPASDKKAEWISLLGGVVSRLGLLEEEPQRFGETVAEVQHVLGESVALCVALSDALGWFGDQQAIGKLNQAMKLTHRRVQTEAAAALAKLGDEEGTKALVALASEPSARLRVLNYAEELMIADRIDPKWTSSEAQAESELAIWLSQPQQFGLPPTELQLLDQRTLYWPGYEEPRECFLFRYAYKMGDVELSNIGIAGPMVHSFASDLANLPEDDIYAAFAGWCAEHEDIYEVDIHHFNTAQAHEAKRLSDHMEEDGLSEIRPMYLGFFVGERALVAMAQRGDHDGIAVSDGLELLWLQTEGRIRPLGDLEVYSIFKGRKIIRTFNPGV